MSETKAAQSRDRRRRRRSGEYVGAIKNKPGALLDESSAPLKEAATPKPLVALDGAPAGLVANHRKNPDACVSQARQKMFTLTDELAR